MRKNIKSKALTVGLALKGTRQIEYISELLSSRQKRRIEERQARRKKNAR